MAIGQAKEVRRSKGLSRLPKEVAFLDGRIAESVLLAAARRATHHGTTAQDELIAAGAIDPDDYSRQAARHLGLSFRSAIELQPPLDPEGGVHPKDMANLGLALTRGEPRAPGIAVATDGRFFESLARAKRARQNLGKPSIVLVPRQAFTDALVKAAGERLVADACTMVDGFGAGSSVRGGLWRWQRRFLLGIGGICAVGAFTAPETTFLIVLILSSIFFLGISILRIAAVVTAAMPERRPDPAPVADSELPVYTLLVPLYREANVVERLLTALDAIDYPLAKLDIKLIAEADDIETITTLRNMRLAARYQIVTVPDSLPKTKPKALNVALSLARGSLVTIFDAEDRPQADQLRRAAAAFSAAPAEVACLQARLAWYNWSDNWLTRQFAIEYASLFDVLLPALDRLDLPLPLGGTSNHFKINILRRVGAWDAYNVTEDADLGIRLTRAGYRCGTIGATTWEEAPNRFLPWLRQRTRWLKGWMQTYMVHMRRPRELLRQLGLRRFLAFQAIIGGVVISALVHPIFFTILVLHVLQGDVFLGPDDWPSAATRGLGWATLVAGYGAGFALAIIAVHRRPMRYLVLEVACLPVYWLMMSIAAYRALWQSVTRPFHWEKTAHGLDRTQAKLPRLAVEPLSDQSIQIIEPHGLAARQDSTST